MKEEEKDKEEEEEDEEEEVREAEGDEEDQEEGDQRKEGELEGSLRLQPVLSKGIEASDSWDGRGSRKGERPNGRQRCIEDRLATGLGLDESGMYLDGDSNWSGADFVRSRFRVEGVYETYEL